MARLTSGSWSIGGRTATGNTGRIHENTVIMGRLKHVSLKLTLASGEVGTTGVIMPSKGSVGLVRNLDKYEIDGVKTASGILWKYAVSGNKITPWTVQLKLASGVATATGNASELNLASGGADIGVTGSAVTISGEKSSGPTLQRLGTGVTIGETVFYVTAKGW